MEIAPIPGVRAVALAAAPRPASDWQPRLEIDAVARTEEDAYYPQQQAQARGLEEEDAEELEAEAGTPSPDGSVHLVA